MWPSLLSFGKSGLILANFVMGMSCLESISHVHCDFGGVAIVETRHTCIAQITSFIVSLSRSPDGTAQGVTFRFLSTCPLDKLHQNCTCPHCHLTCPPLEKGYIILNIMCLGQKMSLPAGQVADKIYLPTWIFNLSRETGQPLMSHPVAN